MVCRWYLPDEYVSVLRSSILDKERDRFIKKIVDCVRHVLPHLILIADERPECAAASFPRARHLRESPRRQHIGAGAKNGTNNMERSPGQGDGSAAITSPSPPSIWRISESAGISIGILHTDSPFFSHSKVSRSGLPFAMYDHARSGDHVGCRVGSS